MTNEQNEFRNLLLYKCANFFFSFFQSIFVDFRRFRRFFVDFVDLVDFHVRIFFSTKFFSQPNFFFHWIFFSKIFSKKLRPKIFSKKLRPKIFSKKSRPKFFSKKSRPKIFSKKSRPKVFSKKSRIFEYDLMVKNFLVQF